MRGCQKRHLIVGAPLTKTGGVITGLRGWLAAVPSGTTVEVFFSSTCDDCSLFLEARTAPGVRVTRSLFMSRYLRVLLLPVVMAVLLRILRVRPSVVLSFFPWTMLASSVATRLARLCGIKIRHVAYLAGDPMYPMEPRLRRWLYRILLSVTLYLSDDVVVLSARLVEVLRAQYVVPSRVEVRVVPITTFLQSKSPLVDNEIKKNSGITFGMVTRLSREKGCDIAIRAFARLSDEALNKLLIFGSGPEESGLRDLTRDLGISDRVEFLGWTDSVEDAYRQLHCVLVPSFTEGTPRTILEAASAGVPCIASAVGGIPDIIVDGRTGWLVKPGDIDSLEFVMRLLLEDVKLIASAGLAARAAADMRPNSEQEFSSIFGSKRA